MRGKLSQTYDLRIFPRITPADAGKTIISVRVHAHLQDHPRGCGENKNDPEEVALKKGSPPRMRGKQFAANVRALTAGITPADAGKTICRRNSGQRARDHPRGCGENRSRGVLRLLQLGSPPRMRGKLYATEGVPLKYRITPADAGKTLKSDFCFVIP